MELDIQRNRDARKWTKRQLVARLLWALAAPLFRLSPRVCWSWRSMLLRLFGATIGRNVRIFQTAKIFAPWNLTVEDDSSIGDHVRIYNLGPCRIGAAATVSQFAHLCGGTHDYHRRDLPLVKAHIEVGTCAWICADAFLGPFVSVGEYSIIGARAVVTHDIPPWSIVAGNPAKVIRDRPSFEAIA